MTSAGDQWASGNAYETYMGRWSRQIGRAFIQWLAPAGGRHWLDVGCGTGALTETIGLRANPGSVTGCDPAEGFVAYAREHVRVPNASFQVAGAANLPRRDDGFDVIVSGLALNFIPDPSAAVRAMRDRLNPEGLVAAYVWDYAAGLEFVRYFWDEAVALNSAAATLDEGVRFPLCREPALRSLFQDAGLPAVETGSLEIRTRFENFDDYWAPFLGGTGPAPAYVASLAESDRRQLQDRLRRRLAPSGGPFDLRARAWAVRGGAGRNH
jgi:SAM-dependent methyltransferase